MAGTSCVIVRVAVTQPRTPWKIKKAAPSHLKIPKAVGDALISAVIPNAERMRNKVACVKIPSLEEPSKSLSDAPDVGYFQ